MAHAPEGAGNAVSEPTEVGEANITEFDILQVVPQAIDWIEVGCVAGQAFQLEPRGGTLSQEGPHSLAPVRRQAIPEDQELARNLAEQVLQEAGDAVPVEGLALHLRVDLAGLSERPNDRIVVTGEPTAQDWRLPPWRIGPDNTGQQVERCLIYPEDRPPLATRPPFNAGQRSLRQRSMAASFRWWARTIGFWRLTPRARTSRLTCAR